MALTLPERRAALGRARFYAILDTGYVAPDRLLGVADEIVRGGVDLLQTAREGLGALGNRAHRAGRAGNHRPGARSGRSSSSNDHPGLAEEKSARTACMSGRTTWRSPRRARAGGRGPAGGQVDPQPRPGRRGRARGRGLHRRRARFSPRRRSPTMCRSAWSSSRRSPRKCMCRSSASAAVNEKTLPPRPRRRRAAGGDRFGLAQERGYSGVYRAYSGRSCSVRAFPALDKGGRVWLTGAMPVLVVGSIALDHIKTPVAEHRHLLGGSASYAAVAASFFGPVQLVGVVGHDFPEGAHGAVRVTFDRPGGRSRWPTAKRLPGRASTN